MATEMLVTTHISITDITTKIKTNTYGLIFLPYFLITTDIIAVNDIDNTIDTIKDTQGNGVNALILFHSNKMDYFLPTVSYTSSNRNYTDWTTGLKYLSSLPQCSAVLINYLNEKPDVKISYALSNGLIQIYIDKRIITAVYNIDQFGLQGLYVISEGKLNIIAPYINGMITPQYDRRHPWVQAIDEYIKAGQVRLYHNLDCYTMYDRNVKLYNKQIRSKSGLTYHITKYFKSTGQPDYIMTTISDHPEVWQKCIFQPYIIQLNGGTFFNELDVFRSFLGGHVESGISIIIINIGEVSFDRSLLQGIFYMNWNNPYQDILFSLTAMNVRLRDRLKYQQEQVSPTAGLEEEDQDQDTNVNPESELDVIKKLLSRQDITVIKSESVANMQAKFYVYNERLSHLTPIPDQKPMAPEFEPLTKIRINNINYTQIQLLRYNGNIMPYYIRINNNKILDLYTVSSVGVKYL